MAQRLDKRQLSPNLREESDNCDEWKRSRPNNRYPHLKAFSQDGGRVLHRYTQSREGVCENPHVLELIILCIAVVMDLRSLDHLREKF